MKLLQKILLISLILCFSSCMTTNLSLNEVNEDLARLSYTNSTPVCINIKGELQNSLGHQYVIPFIPVGEINLENSPKTYLYTSMYKVLSLANFSPKFNSNACKDILNINIQDMSLTAYDLFFTRRIVGEIKYQIVYTRDGVLYDMREDSVNLAHYKRYAFKNELEYVFNKLLDEFSTKATGMIKTF